jgi:hypothetical protein
VASAFRRNVSAPDHSGGATIASSCATLSVGTKAVSSIVVWNASSSAIISSTRSSELSPSSSIVVVFSIVRPAAKRARISPTFLWLPPLGGIAAAPDVCCPTSHVFSSRRFSFRVPSVRGSSDPGHTAAARIF